MDNTQNPVAAPISDPPDPHRTALRAIYGSWYIIDLFGVFPQNLCASMHGKVGMKGQVDESYLELETLLLLQTLAEKTNTHDGRKWVTKELRQAWVSRSLGLIVDGVRRMIGRSRAEKNANLRADVGVLIERALAGEHL